MEKEILLKKAQEKVKEIGLNLQVKISTKKEKKLMAILPNGKVVHFGQKGSITYLEGASDEKRKSYLARASKITNKSGEYTALIPFTSNYLAINILW